MGLPSLFQFLQPQKYPVRRIPGPWIPEDLHQVVQYPITQIPDGSVFIVGYLEVKPWKKEYP
jgi:hypothetical protein